MKMRGRFSLLFVGTILIAGYLSGPHPWGFLLGPKYVNASSLPTDAPETRHPPDDVAPSPDAKNTTNVKSMNSSSLRAGSKIADKKALGGFGESSNMPKKIVSPDAKSSGHVYLLAQPTVAKKLGDGKGMRLSLVNATRDTVAFDAVDGQLHIIQEAKSDSGEWKSIELAPTSWCGNSYHRVFLGVGEYWEFAAPRYEGTLKTKLRFSLIAYEGKSILISKEFEGSINPEQFSVKKPLP
jgi:hypothetical protein